MIIEKLTDIFFPLLTALIVILLIPHCTDAQQETVKIGVIIPLTGAMSTFGEDMAKAIPMLENKFNSEQNKYNFKFIIEDGQFGHSNAAITAAKKLFSIDGINFLMVGSSGETLQVAPFAEANRILTVAGFSSHPDVKGAGDYIFRTYIDAERGVSLIADDIHQKKLSRVAIISEETSFTLAIKKALQEFLAKKVVFFEDFSLGATDFNTLIAKAKTKQPEAYYLNISTPSSFIALVRQLRAYGSSEQLYTYYAPSLKDVQESLGSALNDTIFLDFPDTPSSSQEFINFLDKFEIAYGEVQSLFNFKTNYNAIKVLYDGIMAEGNNATKVKDYLYQYSAPSATGLLQFDKNGDVLNLNLKLSTYKPSHSCE